MTDELITRIRCDAKRGRCSVVIADLRKDDIGYYIAPAIFGRRTPSAVDVELSCDEDVLLEAMECPQHDGTTARGRSTRATVRLNGVRMTDVRAAIGGRRRGILVRPHTRWSLTATDELD